MNKFFKLFIALGMLLTSSLGYSIPAHGCQSGIIVNNYASWGYIRQDTAELKPTITPGPDYHYYLAEYDVQLDYSLWMEESNCSLSFNRKNNSAFFSNNGFRIDEKPVFRIYRAHCTSYAALEPSAGVVDDELKPSVTWFHNNSYGLCYAKFKVTFKLFPISGETYDESKPIYTPEFTLVDRRFPNKVQNLGSISKIQKPPANCSVVLSSKTRK
jgi:hypothetical protein